MPRGYRSAHVDTREEDGTFAAYLDAPTLGKDQFRVRYDDGALQVQYLDPTRSDAADPVEGLLGALEDLLDGAAHRGRDRRRGLTVLEPTWEHIDLPEAYREALDACEDPAAAITARYNNGVMSIRFDAPTYTPRD